MLTLAAATSCGEPPSYLVRWKLIERSGKVDDLTSVKQCADVGISKVRITTRRDQVVVDWREYPCFQAAFEHGEGVEGPALPPGEYEVEVEGLRRTGEPWSCELEPCIAFAGSTVTVAAGELPQIEVELRAPPECDDGIDNDRDGRVDGKDPGCVLDPSGPEAADSGLALFQIKVGFLGSPAVKPVNVMVRALRLEVDGELLELVMADQLDTSQYPFRLPLIGRSIDPGDHLFSIVAVDNHGVPLTSAYEEPLNIEADQPGYLDKDFDFGSEQFLAPIIQPFALTVGLTLDQLGDVTSTCGLGGHAGVAIDRMRFRVKDQDGQSLDAATLGLAAMAGPIAVVDEDNGWVSSNCPTAMLRSADFTWGRYSLELEGRIGDVACFTSDGSLGLAPVGNAGAQSFFLQRIVDAQGAPPPGCEECFGNSDCSGQICDAGICKNK